MRRFFKNNFSSQKKLYICIDIIQGINLFLFQKSGKFQKHPRIKYNAHGVGVGCTYLGVWFTRAAETDRLQFHASFFNI